jgi:hypothetical protein
MREGLRSPYYRRRPRQGTLTSIFDLFEVTLKHPVQVSAVDVEADSKNGREVRTALIRGDDARTVLGHSVAQEVWVSFYEARDPSGYRGVVRLYGIFGNTDTPLRVTNAYAIQRSLTGESLQHRVDKLPPSIQSDSEPSEGALTADYKVWLDEFERLQPSDLETIRRAAHVLANRIA